MSNGDIVRLFYEASKTDSYREALAAGDLENWLDRPENAPLAACLDPELTIVEPAAIPDQHTWSGPEAWFEAMQMWPTYWDDFEADLSELREDGDVVYHEADHRGTVRGGTTPLDMRVYNAQWFRDGKLYRWLMYLDRDEALAAAGLSAEV